MYPRHPHSYYFFTLERIRCQSLASYFVDATGIHATIRSSFSLRTFPSLCVLSLLVLLHCLRCDRLVYLDDSAYTWHRMHGGLGGVHRDRRRWIFERRVERKKRTWYDEARQERREANLTRFSRANKNRDGEHNGMPEENLSLPFLHPPGEYFTCLFSFSFSPLFFSRSCLKSILIKCKSESSQPSRLFFRVEEFSLLLFFFYFRFSIFCKVFCAFNVKTCGLILGFDLSRPDQLYSLSSSLWIPTRISLMEILSNLFLLQAIFMYL